MTVQWHKAFPDKTQYSWQFLFRSVPFFLQVQIGSIINITKCSLHYDETDLSGGSVVVVQELVVTGYLQLSDQELTGIAEPN